MPSRSRFDPPVPVLMAAVALFGLSLWLRLSGTGWDGWANLHPDERHMMFVTQDMQRAFEAGRSAGQGWWQLWFGPGSAIDPRAGGRLYVYGDMPLWVVTLTSRWTGVSDWGSTLLLGRSLTAAVDASALLAVFVLALRLTRDAPAALAAAALATLAPTTLQLANFFTADAWLATFCTWALVPMAAMAGQGGRLSHALAAGAFAALAAACKVTAAALVVPALAAVALVWHARGGRAAVAALFAGLAAALAVYRVANPSTFAGPGFWGLAPAPAFVANFIELADYMHTPDLPPNWQWKAGYPAWALARDAMLFAAGPVLSLAALAGLLRAVLRPRAGLAAILLAAAAAHLALNATGETRALRYLAPLVPVAAILTAPILAGLPRVALIALVAVALWWGWGVVRLHDGQHPRLIATEWMRALPASTAIAFETDWDESLPVLQMPPEGEVWEMPGPFRQVPLKLTDPDSAETPGRLADALAEADYVAISSGRQIEVMPRFPDRFRTVTRYYAALLSGQLCFTRALYLDRGYPLPFLRLDDRFVQEPWRVYDHPVVQIWKKEPCFQRDRVDRLLAGD